MEKWFKTDIFIKLLDNAIFSVSPLWFRVHCSEELLQALSKYRCSNKGKMIRKWYLDKYGKDLFSTDLDAEKKYLIRCV